MSRKKVQLPKSGRNTNKENRQTGDHLYPTGLLQSRVVFTAPFLICYIFIQMKIKMIGICMLNFLYTFLYYFFISLLFLYHYASTCTAADE